MLSAHSHTLLPPPRLLFSDKNDNYYNRPERLSFIISSSERELTHQPDGYVIRLSLGKLLVNLFGKWSNEQISH